MRWQEAGFSLLEVIVVIALVLITCTVAVIQMRTTVTMLDADKTSNLVVSQLAYARQLAVDERRNMLVEFLQNNEIKVTRQDNGGGTTLMADVALPSGYIFGLPTGVGDTPDGFGNAHPVYFNNTTSGTFLGDGTFVDASGVLLSGTIFTISFGNGTARAITLGGSTGRVKQYWLQGTTWVVR